jgi:hypothetical protein
MMRVTVEIVPGGNEDMARKIATLDIGNVSDLAEISNYEVIAKMDNSVHPKRFMVRGHRRSKGWPALLRLICAKLSGER